MTWALMGAVGLGIYEVPPAPSRSYPVYNVDGGIVYPQFAYRCIRRRSIEDFLTTTMGLLKSLKSLITAALLQVWLKWLIGGLRPHFYAVRQLRIPTGGSQRGIAFANIMYDRSVCTGDKGEIDDSLESFPSGHSTAGFASLIYLALYFNAQFKVMSAHNPAYWKMIIFFAPILGATLIAGALTIDEFRDYPLLSSGFATNGPFFTYQWKPASAVLPSWSLPVAREGGWATLAEGQVGVPFDANAVSASKFTNGRRAGFTPTNVVDMDKEREWAGNIGMMDWDNTKIVFTKRSLIEFLKYTGTTVDTNFSNIAKLPRYATFGKISQDVAAEVESHNIQSGSVDTTASPPKEESSSFRPSRRVRTTPGGPTSGLFEEEFPDDALSHAPPKMKATAEPAVPAANVDVKPAATEDILLPTSGVRPSRRVRTAPGGKDSLAGGLWGGESDHTEFKPTRRVRQGPGGQDSVASLLG
ncbi:hypothetical protein ACEPAG_5395 [Sanghuangporus baumii]